MIPPADAETVQVAGGTTTAGAARPELVATPGFALGDRIGRYIVRGLLGAGGMGDVYRAYDPDLDRQVAIKLLRQQASANTGPLRLLREAQALARLSHPNVVAVYDVGLVGAPTRASVIDSIEGGTDELVFVAMELVEGLDLATWLTRPRALPEILEVFVAAARGLSAAHAVGIVHRDFKPANVLVATHGPVRVADFGLARMLSDTEGEPGVGVASGLLQTQMTGTGFVMGTPPYMAPEVHAGAIGDAAADQYAFFVACYEAIYGRRPFVADDLAGMLAAKRKGLVQVPAEPAVPGWLSRMLIRGLDPDPRARFPSIAVVVDEIERRGRPRHRNAIVLAIAGAAALGGWAAFGGQSDAERCAHVDALVAATWSPARADAIAATVADHDTPAWTRLRADLDGYAARWHAAYRERCVAVPAVGQAPWQQLDPDVRCLRHQWYVLAGLVHQLDGGDGGAIAAIATAVSSLPPATACSEALSGDAVSEAPAALAVQVEDLRVRADEVEAMSLAGRYREALDTLGPIEADARAVEFAPLHLELLATRGYLHDYLAEYDAAATALEEVVYEGQAIGYDRLATHSLRTLLFVMATHQGRTAEAGALLRLADAMARRTADPKLGAEMTEARAIVALQSDDLVAGERLFRQALVEADEHVGAQSRFAANVAANLGNLLLRMGRPSEAEPLIRRALDFHRGGADVDATPTPQIASAQALLGVTEFQLGRYRESATDLGAALAMREQMLGPDHPRTLGTVHNLAALALARGDLDTAEALARRVLDAAERSKIPDPSARAVAHMLSGQAAMIRGDAAAADAALRRALVLAGDHGPGTAARSDLAVLWRVCGRLDQAAAAVAQVRASDAASGGAAPTLDDHELDDALIELARGQSDRAATRLQRVIDGVDVRSPIEHQQVLQRALVIAALVQRRGRRDCAAALQLAARATALDVGAEGNHAWWRALGWAESAAARMCLGDHAAAERDFASMAAALDQPSVPPPPGAHLLAAQQWWKLRIPDLASAWIDDGRARAPASAALDDWDARHRLDCGALTSE